jgi:hypothetical protein
VVAYGDRERGEGDDFVAYFMVLFLLPARGTEKIILNFRIFVPRQGIESDVSQL